MDIEDVKDLNDAEIIARADAQAWETQEDEYISISKIEYDIKDCLLYTSRCFPCSSISIKKYYR